MNGNITKPPLSMVYHEVGTEKGDTVQSNGEEFVAAPLNSEDKLLVSLDADKCRFDASSGTLILVQTNRGIVRISGFSELSAIVSELGRRGPRGPAGRDGKRGRSGRDGKNGDQGCDGAKGDTGPQGNTGATGPTGATGSRGDTGPTGATGATGSRGADATAGRLLETPKGMAEVVDDTGRKFQFGHFQADAVEDTVTLLFPIAFDYACTSFVAFWMDGKSVQAQEYEVLEVDKGGVTLHVPQTPPLADAWDFYWVAKGK